MASTRDAYAVGELKRKIECEARGFASRGMTHALTITPDWHGMKAADGAVQLERLMTAFGRDVGFALETERWNIRGAHGKPPSRQLAKKVAFAEFAGYPEFKTKRVLDYPHVHLAIAAPGSEAYIVEGYCRERIGWGEPDEDDNLTSHELPLGKPILDFLGRQAHAFMEPIWNLKGWVRYLSKHTDERSELLLATQFTKGYLQKVALSRKEDLAAAA